MSELVQISATSVSARVQLPVSEVISKSMLSAMGCETYFCEVYMPGLMRGVASDLMQSGKDFHDWREAYLRHLEATGLWSDPAFAGQWLSEHAVSDDARQLIWRDVKKFEANPEEILAVEAFIVLDKNFALLEMVPEGHENGRLSTHHEALVCGQPDAAFYDGHTVTIHDYKSGHSTETQSDHEPKVYIPLIAAIVPDAEEFVWRWEYPRFGLQREVRFKKRDLPAMRMLIQQKSAQKVDILQRWNNGDVIYANPTAGHCGHCPVRCAARVAEEREAMILGPIQTEDDFQRLCAYIMAADSFLSQARQRAKQYLDEQPEGRSQLSPDYVAKLETTGVKSLPLVEFLKTVGLGLVKLEDVGPALLVTEETPEWKIPLKRLTVGGTSQYAKAIKRAGLKDALAAIASFKPRTTFKIMRELAGIGEVEFLDEADSNEEE